MPSEDVFDLDVVFTIVASEGELDFGSAPGLSGVCQVGEVEVAIRREGDDPVKRQGLAIRPGEWFLLRLADPGLTEKDGEGKIWIVPGGQGDQRKKERDHVDSPMDAPRPRRIAPLGDWTHPDNPCRGASYSIVRPNYMEFLRNTSVSERG